MASKQVNKHVNGGTILIESKMKRQGRFPSRRAMFRILSASLMLTSLSSRDVTAFVTEHSLGRQSRKIPTRSQIAMTPFIDTTLKTKKTSKKSFKHDVENDAYVSSKRKQRQTGNRSTATKLLSPIEEKRLLLQVAEYRRIQKIEKELTQRHASKTGTPNSVPFLTVRAKAAGYEDKFEEYETAIDDGIRARETLITRNMGLVYYCVNAVIGKPSSRGRTLNSLSRDDLVQEGIIGLARSIDKYNADCGTKFSTYSIYWIRAAILRCVAEKDDLLRVPEHVSAAVRKLTAAAQRLGIDIDSAITTTTKASAWKEATAAKALAMEAGLTEKQLEQAMRVKARRSLGGYTTLDDMVESSAEENVDYMATSSQSTSQIIPALSQFLRPKEMEALSWRYGLKSNDDNQLKATKTAASKKSKSSLTVAPPTQGKWGEAMSFTEVGKAMSISDEYGRRLCHAALKKLRAAAEEGKLEAALLF